MDRKPGAKKSNFFKTPEAKWGGGVIFMAIAVFAYHAGHSGAQHAAAEQGKGEHATAKTGAGAAAGAGAKAEPQGIVAIYKAAFESTQQKVAEVQQALEENERLRYENTNLRLKLETSEFECHEKEAAQATLKIGAKVADETGSRVARTLASIAYKPPESLLPNQLYTLGVTYFKAHEDEKAAVIFSFLTNLEDNNIFQNAHNYLMTGVAWYRVDNFEMANLYFDKALKEKDLEDNLQFQAQARLWKGLIAQHQGKEKEAQYWLKDLIDHHPHSLEASWVNAKEAEHERKPDVVQE